jgi:hypothetical protein
MSTSRFPLRKEEDGTPQISQHEIEGVVRLSWNPDDSRFYVEKWNKEYSEWHTAGNYKEWRNAVAHAKRMINKALEEEKEVVGV